MNNTMNINIPELNIETTPHDKEGLIWLEQETCGTINRIAIHPMHLRHMAETLGLVENAETAAQKLIESLTRRLQVLQQRMTHLGEYLETPDNEQAALSYAKTYSTASAEIAEQFCADLDNGEQEAAHV